MRRAARLARCLHRGPQFDTASYREQGAVAIRGLLTPAEVHVLCVGIEGNLASPGPLGATASRETDPGRFFEDFCNWSRDDAVGEAYRSVIFDSALPAVAALCLTRKHWPRLTESSHTPPDLNLHHRTASPRLASARRSRPIISAFAALARRRNSRRPAAWTSHSPSSRWSRWSPCSRPTVTSGRAARVSPSG